MARLYNLLSIGFLALTALFLIWMGMVVLNPHAAVNPFPPPTDIPTALPVAKLVGPSATPAATFVRITLIPSFTPTFTPSLTPTATDTPLPTFTASNSPTPLPPTPTAGSPFVVQVANTEPPPQPEGAPAATQPPPPPAPVAAASAGGFELGGQVAGFSYPDQMKYAGMWWVKRQLRWGPGSNPEEARGMIEDAHAKGFKILLSVLGDPESLRGGANYGAFANFVGGVAALGADGIEVWNEMNIDREWPSGEISPAAYTELLRQAYTAIKASNPGTLVISGAPAPTGYFGGCGGIGCDDKPYIEGMVNAGALNYMDCMGIHYNEGVVSPTQSSGDPRGNPNHYTRYYQTMVDTYYNAGGGRRKLCFTELGYLTGEGFSPALVDIAPGFAWAADTSLSEQAQWLAEAASLARSSGKVRLLIVFNVDLTHWGADPQAGFAIVRPGGGCPACESLRGVTGGR